MYITGSTRFISQDEKMIARDCPKCSSISEEYNYLVDDKMGGEWKKIFNCPSCNFHECNDDSCKECLQRNQKSENNYAEREVILISIQQKLVAIQAKKATTGNFDSEESKRLIELSRDTFSYGSTRLYSLHKANIELYISITK